MITKISSLSALVACAAAPILALLFGRADALLVILAMVALIVYRHRPNISRLLAGTEPRFGARKDDG